MVIARYCINNRRTFIFLNQECRSVNHLLIFPLKVFASSLLVLPDVSRRQVMKLIHPGIREEDGDVLTSCISRLSNFSLAASEDHHGVKVLCPPISRCVTCNAVLVPHNRPVKVDFFGIRGPSEGIKVSLKCNHCGFFYSYSKYGNPQAGWSLYETPRVAIEASDVCFVELSLLRWQISLS